MKITKYPQSCLVIEQDGKRIAIDPGSFVAKKYSAADLLPLDAILITHEHPDHADPALLHGLISEKNIPVIANQSAANILGELVTQVVSNNEAFEIVGMHIIARELPHCLMPDESLGPQNTGYVVEGTFFHPGDGINIQNLQIHAAAVPLAGPDISPKDVFDFIKQTACQTVVPIHYDHWPANPELIADVAHKVVPGTKFIVLQNGESADL